MVILPVVSDIAEGLTPRDEEYRSSKAERTYWLGLGGYQEGQFELAQARFKEALQQCPTLALDANPQNRRDWAVLKGKIHAATAACYIETGKYEEALHAGNQANQWAKESALPLKYNMLLAYLAIVRSVPEQALELCEAAIAINSHTSKTDPLKWSREQIIKLAKFMRGIAKIALRRFAEARADLESFGSGDGNVKFYLAMCCEKEADAKESLAERLTLLSQAMDLYRSSGSRIPRHQKSIIEHLEVVRHAHATLLAAEAQKSALKEQQDSAELLLMQQKIQALEQRLASHSTESKVDTSESEELERLGLECKAQGRYLEACQHFTRLAQQKPEWLRIMMYQAESLYLYGYHSNQTNDRRQHSITEAKNTILRFLMQLDMQGGSTEHEAAATQLLEKVNQSLDELAVARFLNPYIYREADDLGESIAEWIDSHAVEPSALPLPDTTPFAEHLTTFRRHGQLINPDMQAAIAAANQAQLAAALAADPGQLNAQDSAGNTPLHLLVKRGALECVEYLLQRGADANRTNHQFQTPLDLTYRQDMRVTLLIQRKMHDSALVDAYVATCFEHYLSAPVSERENVLKRQLARYASRLTGVNVAELLSQPGMRIRYLAHLEELKGTNPDPAVLHDDDRSLEGWRPEVFMPLRIYSTLEVLVRLRIQQKAINAGHYSPADWPQGSMPAITNTTLNTDDRQRLYDAASKVIIRYRDYLRSEVEAQATHRHQDTIGIGIRSLSDSDRILLAAVTQGVLVRLSQLADGHSAYYYAGYQKHAIYLKVTRHAAQYQLTIHNLGQGYPGRHRFEAGEVYAFPLGILSKSELDKVLAEPTHPFRCYLESVFSAECMQMESDLALPQLYIREPTALRLMRLAEDPRTKSPPQLGGHCVLRNDENVRKSILGAEYTDFLTTQEKQQLVDRARALPQELEKTTDDGSTIYGSAIGHSVAEPSVSGREYAYSPAEDAALRRVAQRHVERLCALINPLLRHFGEVACYRLGECYVARMRVSRDPTEVIGTLGCLVNELNGENVVMTVTYQVQAMVGGEERGYLYFRCDPERLARLERKVQDLHAALQRADSEPMVAIEEPRGSAVMPECLRAHYTSLGISISTAADGSGVVTTYPQMPFAAEALTVSPVVDDERRYGRYFL